MVQGKREDSTHSGLPIVNAQMGVIRIHSMYRRPEYSHIYRYPNKRPMMPFRTGDVKEIKTNQSVQ